MRHAPKKETALTKEQIEDKRPAPPKGWKQSKMESQTEVHYENLTKPDADNTQLALAEKIANLLRPFLSAAVREEEYQLVSEFSKIELNPHGFGHIWRIELTLLMGEGMECRVFWSEFNTLEDTVSYFDSEFIERHEIPHNLAKRVWRASKVWESDDDLSWLPLRTKWTSTEV